MHQISPRWLGCVLLSCCSLTLFAIAQTTLPGRLVSTHFKQLTRASQWQLTASLPINFNTHHPQGLVKIGDVFYVSSVEVTQPTKRFARPQNGFDRDTGAGVGHLFKFDRQGELLADLTLGEGTIYHPGGIDYDGKFIWVPVAEYRPNSRAIVYRVDPTTLKATEDLRFADHLGGLVHNTDTHSLHAVTWGSRFFYRWTLDAQSRVTNSAAQRHLNPSFYIDYQDCKYLGRSEMLCGGLSSYQRSPDGLRFSLGGLELIDLTTQRALHQLPLELWTESGLPMTQNPFWLEPAARGLRAYFLPEDQNSTLYVFEVNAP
ncbi:MAG: hypothetical protein HY011_23130 [Acidobacteria bacterium]|nr:hypothetical protein [Acidobacteriota bacterium]